MQGEHLSYAETIELSGSQIIGLMRAVLSHCGVFRFRAGGTSMSPFIRDGDVISVVPVTASAPGVGAVLAYQRPHPALKNRAFLVVHRLVRKFQQGLFFLGDNQAPIDIEGPMEPDDVLGMVSSIERSGKKVRFGLGPERFLIALASRFGLLRRSVRFVSIVRMSFKRLFWIKIRTR